MLSREAANVATSTPRERYRAQNQQEAKAIALSQLAESGPAGVSLNAIAKQMGLTGPALYRYFGSREDLFTELISDSYEDLADFAIANDPEDGADPATRLRRLARAYRAWALAEPHRYLLIYGTPMVGYSAPAHTTRSAYRMMVPALRHLALLPPLGPEADELDRQLKPLIADREPGADYPPTVMRRGIAFWVRMHGVVSLEVAGHFTQMGFDPALLFEAEVTELIKGTRTSYM
jgi:AcrR family transcriptional regulator